MRQKAGIVKCRVQRPQDPFLQPFLDLSSIAVIEATRDWVGSTAEGRGGAHTTNARGSLLA